MITATKEFLQQIDAMSEKRRQEILNAPDALDIRGTIYYVSNSGDDSSDGRSPGTAWKTLAKVSSAELKEGDGVLFERGGLFRGKIMARAGVTYGAYGEGEKPKLYGWDRSLDDPALWTEVDPEHHIWKWGERLLDPGTLVFNHGEAHSVKLIPSYINGKFVCRNDESKFFDMRAEMVRDLDIYWHFEDILTTRPSKGQDFPIPEMGENSLGELYLRCDRGNPGEVFDSIEAPTRRAMFYVGSNPNVRIDNLCMKYIGLHAIAAGGACVKGLHVSNCEIGWIGGTIQHYFGTDPNYPEGGRGTVTRFGNGIEIYGGCDNYTVENCYIYQVYDAGITHQVTTGGRKYAMTNILYRNNLVEYCVYSIEYFLEMTNGDTESCMDGIEMCGNILRHSGYGWGQQRHNYHTPAHIKGWSYTNKAANYTVHDNIFDRAAYRMLHLVAEKDDSCPDMHGNTYIQHEGGMIGQYGGNELAEPEILVFDDEADVKIEKIFGDTDAKVYIIRP
ncbi:MAG: hypothetical protein IJ493_08375 [Clostridia bacterium]|nr:hypothetical protein [Clostridia bacterium]